MHYVVVAQPWLIPLDHKISVFKVNVYLNEKVSVEFIKLYNMDPEVQQSNTEESILYYEKNQAQTL